MALSSTATPKYYGQFRDSVIRGEIMSSAGKKALGVVAAGAMVYGVKAAMTRKFDIKEAAGYIDANPNKKK